MEVLRKVGEIHESHRHTAIRVLHDKAVDMSGSTEAKFNFIGHICTYWLKSKQITKQDYVSGLAEYLNTLADIGMDVPKLYEWTVQMMCKYYFAGLAHCVTSARHANHFRFVPVLSVYHCSGAHIQ